MHSRKTWRVVAGVVAGAALAACADDRASVFAPFGEPAYVMRVTPNDARNIPSGSVATAVDAPGPPTNNALVVTLRNLKPLASGRAYGVWLVDSAGTTFRLARAIVIRTQVDTSSTGITTTVDSSYTGLVLLPGAGRANVTYAVRIRRSTLGSRPDSAPYFQTLVTVGDSTPSDTSGALGARPLWRRFRGGGGAVGNLSFGNWFPEGTPSYTFRPAGNGLGHFRADELTVDFTGLSRPPMGYAYRAFLVATDSSSTLVSGLTAPYPRQDVSLDGGDSALVDPEVNTIAFVHSNARAFAGDIGLPPNPETGRGWYRSFVRLYLTLEPKLSDLTQRGPSLINSGEVPPSVFNVP